MSVHPFLPLRVTEKSRKDGSLDQALLLCSTRLSGCIPAKERQLREPHPIHLDKTSITFFADCWNWEGAQLESPNENDTKAIVRGGIYVIR